VKIKKQVIRKFKSAQAFTPVLVVGLLVVVGAVIYNLNAHAATAGFYFTSSTNAYTVGDTVNVGIYEDSGTDCTNVVQADFSYPTNLLRYDSFSASGSKLDIPRAADSGNGKISIIQYTKRKECGTGGASSSGVSGTQLIGTASFTVVAAGNASLDFLSSSIAISAADNRANVAPGSSSKGFVLSSAPVDPPIPVTPPPPGPPAEPAQPPEPEDVTAVTPDNSDDSIALTDNSVVEVTTPVDINPLPILPDGVNRVEYYLNKKLVATVKTAPYKYHLDAVKFLNGEYTLTTKTFFANGQTKSTSETVLIKNPFGLSQVNLWAQKYAWLIILILLVIAAAVAAWIIHRKNGGPDNYNGNNSGTSAADYTVTTSDVIPVVIAPDEGNSAPQAPEPEVYHPTGPTTK